MTSSTHGRCTAPPLTTSGGGQGCSLDGKLSYQLGPSLGDLTITHAQLAIDPQTNEQLVAVNVDKPSATTLKTASMRSIGDDLAILLGGRVAMAATVQGSLDGGQLQIVNGNPAVVAQVAAALHATPASPDDTSGDFSPPAAQDTARYLATCRKEQPKAAAGMHVEAGIVNTASQTAADAARWMSQMGDSAAASVWARQPADEQVFLCNYVGSKPKNTAIPSCPPGQTPVVDDLGPVRSFLVDEHGHATELKVPNAAPTSGCSTD